MHVAARAPQFGELTPSHTYLVVCGVTAGPRQGCIARLMHHSNWHCRHSGVKSYDASALGAAPAVCLPRRSAYEHPRCYCIETEEHHHVEGPELSKATTLFAKSKGGHWRRLRNAFLSKCLASCP